MTLHRQSPVLEVANHQDDRRYDDACLSAYFPRWAEKHYKVHCDIIGDYEQKLRPKEIEPEEVAKQS